MQRGPGLRHTYSYVNDKAFTTKEKQFLFKLRTSMSDVRMNFSSMHQDTNCNLSDGTRKQTVQHLLCCPQIFRNCLELQNNSDVIFNDIFSEVKTQLRATQALIAAFEAKVKLETD